ncbi:MAG: NTP transferase domain-containing protein [Candidatus Stahlbacteria bacterium]|nr:NTP transferase domain-containing protein [Candidatus Stahlbacteria bacterium]
MNVIIPVAGIGKRLRPHTYSTHKSLLMVGDKPILGHILDKLKAMSIHKVIFIVGYMGEKIKAYVSGNYDFNAVYVEQKEALGLGHAIWLTRETAKDESCLIIYGDTIFEGEIPIDMNVDGIIGVKAVDNPRRFGIVETESNLITKFIEKPTNPTSNLAICGVNFIKNSHLLFEHLDQLINKNKKTAACSVAEIPQWQDEFQLTDAFQSMLEKGACFKSFNIDKWYDCGTPETIISTNSELLSSQTSNTPSQNYKNLTIIEPVFIHNTAKIEHSIIGPNVSIDRDTDIRDSIIFDSIINQGASIENSRLEHSIIGANTIIKGAAGKLNIGRCSEIILAK